MVQSLTETVTNAKHVSMACAVINNGKPTGNTPFRMESVAWAYWPRQAEGEPASKALLFVEEGKQEQPTKIAMLQTRSILRQKASLYEKL